MRASFWQWGWAEPSPASPHPGGRGLVPMPSWSAWSMGTSQQEPEWEARIQTRVLISRTLSRGDLIPLLTHVGSSLEQPRSSCHPLLQGRGAHHSQRTMLQWWTGATSSTRMQSSLETSTHGMRGKISRSKGWTLCPWLVEDSGKVAQGS